MSATGLLAIAATGVLLVVVLSTWVRLPAFLALVCASVFVGVAAGMPLAEVPRSFQAGVGDTLGFITMVIALGTVMGKLLAESGGATVVARALAKAFGARRLDWAFMAAALLIGLPVFFQVGLVLLAPVVFTAVRQNRTPLLALGIPLVAGLSVVHGLTPPHPGPLAAIERLGADTGRTLLYAIAISVPIAIIAGPLFARFISARVVLHDGGRMAEQLAAGGTATDAARRLPSLGVTLLTILMPALLMLAAALADATLPRSQIRSAISLAGNPLVAMVIATLLSFITFGRACGFNRTRLLTFAEEALPPIASVLLVVGAGGGFGRVLLNSGIAAAITASMEGLPIVPLVLGWTIAAVLRLAVGSATVACVTAASIIAPMAVAMHVSRELMVLSVGAGSLIASHVNDGGFWLVKEYFDMTVPQTLATWTIMETIISVAGLAAVLLMSLVVS